MSSGELFLNRRRIEEKKKRKEKKKKTRRSPKKKQQANKEDQAQWGRHASGETGQNRLPGVPERRRSDQ